MIAVTKESGQIKYTVNEYIIDGIDDLELLPANTAIGSKATDTSTGKKYIFTSNNEWVEYVQPGGGGGGSSITVVQTTGTSTSAVMSQNAVTQALESAGPEVVQETGDSESVVMSQAAVTAALDNIDVSDKMDKNNPECTGTFMINKTNYPYTMEQGGISIGGCDSPGLNSISHQGYTGPGIGASGNYAVILGGANGCQAKGNYSLSGFGGGTVAYKDYAIAIGSGASAQGSNSYAIGPGTQSKKDYNIAIGYTATASNKDDIVFGRNIETIEGEYNQANLIIGIVPNSEVSYNGTMSANGSQNVRVGYNDRAIKGNGNVTFGLSNTYTISGNYYIDNLSLLGCYNEVVADTTSSGQTTITGYANHSFNDKYSFMSGYGNWNGKQNGQSTSYNIIIGQSNENGHEVYAGDPVAHTNGLIGYANTVKNGNRNYLYGVSNTIQYGTNNIVIGEQNYGYRGTDGAQVYCGTMVGLNNQIIACDCGTALGYQNLIDKSNSSAAVGYCNTIRNSRQSYAFGSNNTIKTESTTVVGSWFNSENNTPQGITELKFAASGNNGTPNSPNPHTYIATGKDSKGNNIIGLQGAVCDARYTDTIVIPAEAVGAKELPNAPEFSSATVGQLWFAIVSNPFGCHTYMIHCASSNIYPQLLSTEGTGFSGIKVVLMQTGAYTVGVQRPGEGYPYDTEVTVHWLRIA